ncbi:MAG: acetylxylan esterase [Bacteroidaceae bacterium]|nr:acetylxylan esterase [Bacteroidaceae bacterium]
MKRIILLLLSVFLCVAGLYAQYNSDEVRVIVTPDHPNWDYECGEKAEFTIRVVKSQCLVPNVAIDYEMGPLMYPDEKKENVVLKTGEQKLHKITMKIPGFYRLKVTAKVNGRAYSGLCTISFDKDKIQPVTQLPSDFWEFWKSSLDEARKIPLAPQIELLPERCTSTVNVYHISYQNIRPGSRTYGILCVPKKPGKYPALFRVPGAGIRPYNGDIETASKGAITLEIGIHGIPVTFSQDYYDKLFNGALNSYWEMNMDNKDANYYKRVFIGAVRGVDFICSLPEYNGKALGVTGSSQGGMLSLVTAALDDRVTFIAGIHPAMCDHSASLKKQACGWPHYFYQQENPDPVRVKVSQYYDGVNFARYIKVPAWFAWGYNDDVVSPTSIFAMYNILQCEKEFHPYLESGHWWYWEEYQDWSNWLYRQMGLE